MSAITQIYGYYVENAVATFEVEPPPIEEMIRRWQQVTGAGFPYLVAARGRDVLGYGYLSPYRTRCGYRFVAEDSIYVDRESARQGIGRMLLEALIEEAEVRGLRQLIAVVGDSANRASIALHERCGFAVVGTFRSIGFKHGRWVDTVLLQRALGAGDTTPPAT